MPDTPPPPAAQQQRSTVTQDLLLDAAEAALREGGLTACTIQAVAARAGRSAGSVYRRFGDKDGMIAAVIARYLDRVVTANEANFPLLAERFPHLSDRLKALVDGAVTAQRRDWRLAQALREAAAQSDNPALTAAMQRLNTTVQGLARQTLNGCATEITHPDKPRAIDFAILMLGGAMEAVTRADPPMDDAAIKAELYDMLHGYLTRQGA
ncbi:hypothetical protein GCM10023219_31200 [Stakelama sediminis]|uniref:AcrR family transcriptional regulator n=1 Tax=Stakelama sediminis TaxID=463200 RepID=A0A840Z1M6_9SPHN|nr:TetR/AcrR family transcriptional regulator [Stakelama sediminis]MBB5719689.1 AcrR family transcriptional regulator [Stakelama sediminis]